MSNGVVAHPGPCAGLRVLDLSTVMAGPLCSRILADLGADVIKVESPQGDFVRTVPPFHKGFSAYFAQNNRNKRSMILDLKSQVGQVAAQAIAAKSDIVLENYRPGVAERLGLSYEQLKVNNPSLIYVSINGFGKDGPYADQPAYDQVIQGLVGFVPAPGGDEPAKPIYNPLADKVTAISAALATLAAIIYRDSRGGAGQVINVKMLDAWASFILPEQINDYFFQDLPRSAPSSASNNYRIFDTKDGQAIGMIIQENQFFGMCDAFNRPDLKGDPRFSTSANRLLNSLAIFEEFSKDAAKLTNAEFLSMMRKHQVPFAPVNDIEAFFNDPQVKHNQTYFDMEDPEFGRMRNLVFMAEFGLTPAGMRRRAPKLGEHTAEILREFGLAM